MPPILRTRQRRKMTRLSGIRRRIQKMGPYPSMALLALPMMLVEPLKILALFVAGKGHWLTGTGMIIAAYAVSLLFVERLFKAVKPKLMTLNWFAKLWTGFIAIRDKTFRLHKRDKSVPGSETGYSCGRSAVHTSRPYPFID
jgi:hypothetical protein